MRARSAPSTASRLRVSARAGDRAHQADPRGVTVMGRHLCLIPALFLMKSLGAQAADLVVWWEKGTYAQEDEAIREVIAAFEQDSGKRDDLVLYERAALPDRIEAAIAANRPPDVAFGLWLV